MERIEVWLANLEQAYSAKLSYIPPLPWSDEDITRAARDMIEAHGNGAMAKCAEIVDRLNFEGFPSLAKTWELIRDRFRALLEADRS